MDKGLIHSLVWWCRSIERTFLPAADLGIHWLTERILPTFDDLQNDADEYANRRTEESAPYADPESYDPADAAATWWDFGVEFYSMASDLRQALLNMFAATLFHQFEQALLELYRKECLRFRQQKEGTDYHLKDVVKWFRDELGIEFSTFPSWKTIDELQNLANTVKHAEGRSSAKLRALRPDLFVSPTIPEDLRGSWLTGGTPPVFTPLSGEDIYVKAADLKAYMGAFKEFLEDLKQPLEQLLDDAPR